MHLLNELPDRVVCNVWTYYEIISLNPLEPPNWARIEAQEVSMLVSDVHDEPEMLQDVHYEQIRNGIAIIFKQRYCKKGGSF